jgi:DNA-binding transcriptional LysR family regulator
MLDLAHVRTFLTVVDEKGVRAAARRLQLSPSTVVDHVKQLEAELSVHLLERSDGGLRPTAHGVHFLPYARALVSTAARVKDLLRKPLLRLSSSSNVGTYLLQPAIAAFRRESGVDVEVWIGPNPQVADRLERGEADLAAMEWWDDRPGFRATTWLREPLVLIVSPGHPWAALGEIDSIRLIGQTLLGGEAGSGTGRVLRERLGAVVDRLYTRSGYGNTEAVKRAVRAGHGISIVMRSAVEEDVAAGRLAALGVRDIPLMKEIKLVVSDRLPQTSPAARLVAGCMSNIELTGEADAGVAIMGHAPPSAH